MVFAATLLSYALFVTAAFAAPQTNLNDRLAHRRSGAHLSSPRRPSNGINAQAANVSNVEYSSNWAGAAWESAAGTYKTVTGTFVVPTPMVPSGSLSSGSYAASAWVGIDGDTCGTAILQTGVDFTISDGEVSFDAWYEYYPDFAFDFSGIPISAGQTITVTVSASSSTSGTATITNVSTGKTVSKALTSTAKLCGKNAEWIIEDFEEGSSLVPFANFGTVTFTGAVATTSAGATVGPSGAVLIDIEQSSKVLTTVSTTSSRVTVSYV
ncbi:peptidase A4 family-domain-containing protein [Mycena sp. CBHHK59/15]|nr:peptidase A4 family-domain-containing protein [Mycena sp. CBHHK59/15]